MAPYRFRLATLQKIREAASVAQRQRVAEAQRAESLLGEQLRRLEGQLAEAQRLQREASTVGRVDVNRLLESQRYQASLKAEWQSLRQQAQLIAEEVARRQQVAQEADREVKKLERLDERLRQKHQYEESRAESRAADENAMQQFGRRTES